MSVIAKSLKRLKENKKPKFEISGLKKSNGFFGHVALFYIFLALAFVLIAAIYSYMLFTNTNKKIQNMAFPSILSLQQRLESEKKEAEKVRMHSQGLEDLFVLRQYDKMFELAKKDNNIKYEGLYYFEKDDLDKAYELFMKYLKQHKDDASVKAYIAFVMYKKKMYEQSINILNSIDKNDCNLTVDKAVVYESLGEYSRALSLYKRASKMCKNAIISNKVLKKIIVLEYYLRNANES